METYDMYQHLRPNLNGPMQLIFFQLFLRWQSWWQKNACWSWKRRSPSTTRTWTDPSPLKSFPWFVIIYKSELKMLNQALKAMGRKPSRVEVKDMIGEADADGNGTIEFSEFAALMEKWVVILWSPISSFSSFLPFRISPTLSEGELKEAFAVYDRDGNGQISAAELKQVGTSIVNILTSTNVNSLVESLPIRDPPKYQICIF